MHPTLRYKIGLVRLSRPEATSTLQGPLDLELRVLGPVEAARQGVVLPIRGLQQLVLAVLLARRGEVVSTDSLAAILWPDDPVRNPRAIVQTYVSRLRQALGVPRSILTVGSGYTIGSEIGTDSRRFEARLATGTALAQGGQWAGAAECLSEALALWRGDAYGSLAEVEPVCWEAQRLAGLREIAREDRFEAKLQLGDHRAVLGELEAAVAEQPLRERLWILLMRAQYLSGRPTDALRAGAELRRRLREDVGADPSPAVARLEYDILAHASHLQPQAPRPRIAPTTDIAHEAKGVLAVVGHAGPNLFVGRERDLDVLVSLVNSVPLTTVTGPAGVGKTRTVGELAARLELPPAELIAIAMAPLDQPEALDQLVADALGVAAGPSPRESIGDAIGPRPVLLVLDNAEHLLDATADLVSYLIVRCPAIRVVVTSREPIGLPAERVMSLQPLPPGDASSLFEDRARAGDIDAVLDADLVSRICERVDRLPLAIELVAAKSRSLSLSEIVDRLDDRFGDLLVSRRRGPDRHRTMRAAIDWSYQLLDDDERLVFERLSVFREGFTLPAAEHVAGSEPVNPSFVFDMLDRLVTRSLVAADTSGPVTRYRLLEPIRQVASERLGSKTDAVCLSHAQFYTALAERHPGFRLKEDSGAIEAVLPELANFRQAVQWALNGGHVDLALRLSTSLHQLWWSAGLIEVGTWVAMAANLPAAERHPLYREAQGQAALAAAFRVDLPAWQHHCELGVNTWWEAYARCWWPTSNTDHLRNSRRLVSYAGDDRVMLLLGHVMLASSLMANGRPPDDSMRQIDALMTDCWQSSTALLMAAQRVADGDLAAAIALLDQVADEQDAPWSGVGRIASIQALVWRYELQPAKALIHARACLTATRPTGSRTLIQCALARIAAILWKEDRPQSSAILAAFTAVPAGGATLMDGDPAQEVRDWAADRPELAPFLAQGRQLDFDEAIQLALDELAARLAAEG